MEVQCCSLTRITHNDRVPELLAVIRRGPFAEPNETGGGQHVAPATAHVAPGGWHASASAPMAARPLFNYCLGGATLYQSPGRSKSSTYSLGYVPSAIRWTSRTTRTSMCSPTSAASKPPRSNSCGATRRRRLGSFKIGGIGLLPCQNPESLGGDPTNDFLRSDGCTRFDNPCQGRKPRCALPFTTADGEVSQLHPP